MLIQKEYTHTIAWQIDSLKWLLIKIKKDLEKILFLILNIWSIYIKYLDKANKKNK